MSMCTVISNVRGNAWNFCGNDTEQNISDPDTLLSGSRYFAYHSPVHFQNTAMTIKFPIKKYRFEYNPFKRLFNIILEFNPRTTSPWVLLRIRSFCYFYDALHYYNCIPENNIIIFASEILCSLSTKLPNLSSCLLPVEYLKILPIPEFL